MVDRRVGYESWSFRNQAERFVLGFPEHEPISFLGYPPTLGSVGPGQLDNGVLSTEFVFQRQT